MESRSLMRYRWQQRTTATTKTRNKRPARKRHLPKERHPVLQRPLDHMSYRPTEHPRRPSPTRKLPHLLKTGTLLMPLEAGSTLLIKTGLTLSTLSAPSPPQEFPSRIPQRSPLRQLPRRQAKLQDLIPNLHPAITLPVRSPMLPVVLQRAQPRSLHPRNRTKRSPPLLLVQRTGPSHSKTTPGTIHPQALGVKELPLQVQA
jgi:hypothetical protein